jgi:hypothetical protein
MTIEQDKMRATAHELGEKLMNQSEEVAALRTRLDAAVALRGQTAARLANVIDQLAAYSVPSPAAPNVR